MINYTGKILADSGSELPPNESAVIVGVIQLIGTSISLLLVDRVGRKVTRTFIIVFYTVLYTLRGVVLYPPY